MASKRKAEVRLVERYKLFFGISIAIIIVGLIFGVVNIFAKGSMFNMGVDFEGGYSMTVEVGEAKISNSTDEQKIKDQITNTIEQTSVGTGARDGRTVKVSSFLRQGSGATAGFLVRYKPVEKIDGEANVDAYMEELNDAIKVALTKALFDGDEFAGNVTTGAQMTASLGSELVGRAILAVLVALLLMMIYIAVRFDFVSGLAAIANLIHDILIMMAFMAIFRIEINAAFVGALIAVIGYSINNTVIIFDRIRENVKRKKEENLHHGFHTGMGTEFANRSVRETFMRSLNTTVTTMIMLTLLLIIGVPDIRTFLWPLVIGILGGAYSSMLVSPTLWAKVVNKHPDYLERGAMTSSIRRWFHERAVKRAQRKAEKQKEINDHHDDVAPTNTLSTDSGMGE